MKVSKGGEQQYHPAVIYIVMWTTITVKQVKITIKM